MRCAAPGNHNDDSEADSFTDREGDDVTVTETTFEKVTDVVTVQTDDQSHYHPPAVAEESEEVEGGAGGIFSLFDGAADEPHPFGLDGAPDRWDHIEQRNGQTYATSNSLPNAQLQGPASYPHLPVHGHQPPYQQYGWPPMPGPMTYHPPWGTGYPMYPGVPPPVFPSFGPYGSGYMYAGPSIAHAPVAAQGGPMQRINTPRSATRNGPDQGEEANGNSQTNNGHVSSVHTSWNGQGAPPAVFFHVPQTPGWVQGSSSQANNDPFSTPHATQQGPPNPPNYITGETQANRGRGNADSSNQQGNDGAWVYQGGGNQSYNNNIDTNNDNDAPNWGNDQSSGQCNDRDQNNSNDDNNANDWVNDNNNASNANDGGGDTGCWDGGQPSNDNNGDDNNWNQDNATNNDAAVAAGGGGDADWNNGDGNNARGNDTAAVWDGAGNDGQAQQGFQGQQQQGHQAYESAPANGNNVAGHDQSFAHNGYAPNTSRTYRGPFGIYHSAPRTARAHIEEEPRYDVPDFLAIQEGHTHQVRPAEGHLYDHKRIRPRYLDTVQNPYARFIFKYRSPAFLEHLLGAPLSPTAPAEVANQKIEDMTREELIAHAQAMQAHFSRLAIAPAIRQQLTTPNQPPQKLPNTSFLEVQTPGLGINGAGLNNTPTLAQTHHQAPQQATIGRPGGTPHPYPVSHLQYGNAQYQAPGAHQPMNMAAPTHGYHQQQQQQQPAAGHWNTQNLHYPQQQFQHPLGPGSPTPSMPQSVAAEMSGGLQPVGGGVYNPNAVGGGGGSVHGSNAYNNNSNNNNNNNTGRWQENHSNNNNGGFGGGGSQVGAVGAGAASSNNNDNDNGGDPWAASTGGNNGGGNNTAW